MNTIQRTVAGHALFAALAACTFPAWSASPLEKAGTVAFHVDSEREEFLLWKGIGTRRPRLVQPLPGSGVVVSNFVGVLLRTRPDVRFAEQAQDVVFAQSLIDTSPLPLKDKLDEDLAEAIATLVATPGPYARHLTLSDTARNRVLISPWLMLDFATQANARITVVLTARFQGNESGRVYPVNYFATGPEVVSITGPESHLDTDGREFRRLVRERMGAALRGIVWDMANAARHDIKDLMVLDAYFPVYGAYLRSFGYRQGEDGRYQGFVLQTHAATLGDGVHVVEKAKSAIRRIAPEDDMYKLREAPPRQD